MPQKRKRRERKRAQAEQAEREREFMANAYERITAELEAIEARQEELDRLIAAAEAAKSEEVCDG